MTAALVGEWSRLLATSLAEGGLKHAVVCPGSRSTPFAWALAECPALSCHSIVDERDAAFFALGLARVTGEPALVLSTSGSAAANFFPAVVEASLARLPLLVLTADRPLELQAADAAQTIDQVKLYGDHVRAFFDLGTPDASPSALSAVQRIATQALVTTRSPEPGPVHVNARARKPLEPGQAATEGERTLVGLVDGLIARGVTAVATPGRVPAADGILRLARVLRGAKRGLVVCGPLAAHRQRDAEGVRQLAQKLGMPLFAEATSGLRFDDEREPTADALPWLLRSPALRSALAPDCILRFGAPTTSGGLDALISEQDGVALHVVAEHGHPDALGRARTLTLGPTELVAAALSEALGAHEPSSEQRAFAACVARANGAAWQAVRRATAPTTPLSEPAAARLAVESMPPGGLLVVGNSLPVRLVDDFVPASAQRLLVASQRGANGIDGLVSGAAGSALAHGAPTLLLLGDVSLQHDLGGLAAARLVRSPLALVVIDNDGGRIFEQLPVAKLWEKAPDRAELWLTPPKVAIEHAAALFGLPFAAPRDGDELRAALARALEHSGTTLIHVRVPAHSARDAQRALTTELERSLPPLLPGATTS